VDVGHRTRGFTVSVLITILDGVVVSHYGPVIWQVWSAVPWIRIALLLPAGTGSSSLAGIWAHAFGNLRVTVRTEDVGLSAGMATLPSHGMEGEDV
jgi:hypothetical protein